MSHRGVTLAQGTNTYARRRASHSLGGTPLRNSAASSPITRSRSSARRRLSRPGFTVVCSTARIPIFAPSRPLLRFSPSRR
jgi:hypothetical protein